MERFMRTKYTFLFFRSIALKSRMNVKGPKKIGRVYNSELTFSRPGNGIPTLTSGLSCFAGDCNPCFRLRSPPQA